MVSFINYAPFNDGEKSMIKESMYNLEDIYKATSQDKIEEKLYGSDGEEDSSNNKKKTEKSVASSSQISDDLDF